MHGEAAKALSDDRREVLFFWQAKKFAKLKPVVWFIVDLNSTPETLFSSREKEKGMSII